MSASNLLGIPREDVIPGHKISRATLKYIAMVESELERRYIAAVGAGVVGLPDKISEKIIKAAVDVVADGRFKYGRQAYDSHCLAPSSYPYLLWLTLQPAHPSITRDQADAMLTPETETRIGRAVLEAFGFNFAAKSADPNAQGAVASPSTPSSPPSENAASPIEKSAT